MSLSHTLKCTLGAIVFCIGLFIVPLAGQDRQTLTLHTGWKFAPGPNDNAFLPDFNDAGWTSVTVPHDWAIAGPFDPQGDGNTAKLPWKGEGWYRYILDLPATAFGKRIFLIFDGVMA